MSASIEYQPTAPIILGGSPGATFVSTMVREEAWVMVRTTAGDMNGAPILPEMMFITPTMTMSQ